MVHVTNGETGFPRNRPDSVHYEGTPKMIDKCRHTITARQPHTTTNPTNKVVIGRGVVEEWSNSGLGHCVYLG
jgi:hypothetical protein